MVYGKQEPINIDMIDLESFEQIINRTVGKKYYYNEEFDPAQMNASYRLNTCKLEGQHGLSLLRLMATGAWVSNTYPTCRVYPFGQPSEKED